MILYRDLDELLQYDCWLASDDVRYIATGLGFGACRGNALIGAMMKAYESYEYPSGTNVIRDSKIVEQELTGWVKSNRNTLVGNTLIIGLQDYGKYAKHLYTYTWADEETQKKRLQEIADNKVDSFRVQFVWKIKCFVRGPRFIHFFDKRRGTKAEKIYTFFAYDFLDCGPWYYAKRLVRKIRRKITGQGK